jgi:hypothetical protein
VRALDGIKGVGRHVAGAGGTCISRNAQREQRDGSDVRLAHAERPDPLLKLYVSSGNREDAWDGDDVRIATGDERRSMN